MACISGIPGLNCGRGWDKYVILHCYKFYQNYEELVEFEVLAMVIMKGSVIWYIMLYSRSMLKVGLCFGGTCRVIFSMGEYTKQKASVKQVASRPDRQYVLLKHNETSTRLHNSASVKTLHSL
jgi:hypothetical protein